MKELKTLRTTLYRHFREHARAFPWRRDYNPYHIFVSEIMLQQTQTTRVAEKFPAFIREFPSFSALGRASLKDVLLQWQGLGYNRRAKFLHQSAQIITQEYRGKLPDSETALVSLPGIGPATAASICAFAFNKPTVFIETNIRSVFIHHFFKDRNDVSDGDIIPLIEKTIDRENPRKWYSALMDYGSMLKETIPNPSRRSRHHTVQSKFQGSDRQIRGLILKLLLTHNKLTLSAMTKQSNGDKERVPRIVAALLNEGLVIKTGRSYALPR